MNKSKGIITFIALTVCTLCFAQQINFTIKGRLSNESTSNKVFLQEEDINAIVPLTGNREFSYSGSMPNNGLLQISTNNSYAWSIWVAEGSIELTLEEYSMEGVGSDGKNLLKITSLTGPPETEKRQWFIDNWNALNVRLSATPLNERRDSVSKYFFPVLEEYIYNHPRTELSAHLIGTFPIDADKKDKLLSLLSREVNAEEAIGIKKAIARERLLKKGSAIDNFEQQTLDGKLFSLNTLTAKFTLLEFWSSDCLPCRSLNPTLVKAYNQFHNRGFDVVGISLDVSRKEWQKAVKKDKLPWIQISDLKGWNNAIASKYLIDYMPFNILIDQNSTIVATNLDTESLSKKLDELL
jgi:peroxiredoxin